MLPLQLFEPLDHPVAELLFLRRSRDFHRLFDPANRVGRHKLGFGLLGVVDGNNGAPVRTSFVWTAALRRSAVMRNTRLCVDSLLLVSATKCHVVHTIAFVTGRVARAMCDTDGKQPVYVAMKPFCVDGPIFATTSTLHASNRFTSASQVE